MHTYRVKKASRKSSDTIICMKRDEFLFLISEGSKILRQKDARTGLPYLRDDVGCGYFNFSILDEEEYHEVLEKSRALRSEDGD